MTYCIDTNVLSAVLAAEPTAAVISARLNTLRRAGRLLIHGSVYAELLAAPGNTQSHLDAFLTRGQIEVDWDTTESIWQVSGRTYSAYARRRVRSGGGRPRRILADFLIGAHAASLGATLVTLDDTHYRTSFPALPLVVP